MLKLIYTNSEPKNNDEKKKLLSDLNNPVDQNNGEENTFSD